jgi:acetylornithine/N-succinyldiaminopimelate aminotransferase
VKELYANHMLTVPAGDNVVRILPPLTSTDEDIRIALERIEKAAASLSGGHGGR